MHSVAQDAAVLLSGRNFEDCAHSDEMTMSESLRRGLRSRVDAAEAQWWTNGEKRRMCRGRPRVCSDEDGRDPCRRTC